METVLSFVGLVALLGAGAGLISLLVPLKFLGIASRKRGALVLLVSALVFGAAVFQFAPDTDPALNEPASAALEPAADPIADVEVAPAQVLAPDEALAVNVTFNDQSGLIDLIEVVVDDAEGIDTLATLGTLARSVPSPGIAPSATIVVHIDRAYVGVLEDGTPLREMAGQIWRREPQGRAQWAGGSHWETPLGGAALERDRYFVAQLRDLGQDPMDPDPEITDQALEATRTAFGLAGDAWPLPVPGDLLQLNAAETQELVRDAEPSSQWESALAAIVDPLCQQSAACVYTKNIGRYAVACEMAIEQLVLTDTDWPFLATASQRFSRFAFAEGGPSVLTLAGDQVRVENVFGTWVDHRYFCDVDIATGTVIDAALEPGRF